MKSLPKSDGSRYFHNLAPSPVPNRFAALLGSHWAGGSLRTRPCTISEHKEVNYGW
jgi:hypothetical protein